MGQKHSKRSDRKTVHMEGSEKIVDLHNLKSNEDLNDKSEFIIQAKQEFYEGNNLFRNGKYEEAKEFYLKAICTLKASEDPDGKNKTKLLPLSHSAILEYVALRSEQANKLLSEAIDEHRKSASLLKVSSNVGLSTFSCTMRKDLRLQNKGEDEKALDLERRESLAYRITEHGTFDAMVADIINNLAVCYEIVNQIKEAKGLYENSLTLRSIVFGKRSLLTAESMQNLATIYDAEELFDQACDLLTEALSIEIDELGEDCVESAVTMNNLGVLCVHLNQYDRAVKLLEKSVEIRTQIYGKNNFLTKSAQSNLDYCLQQMGTKRSRSKSEEIIEENKNHATVPEEENIPTKADEVAHPSDIKIVEPLNVENAEQPKATKTDIAHV